MLTSRVDDVEVVRQLEAGLDAAYRIRAIVETHEAHHPAWERGPARPLAPFARHRTVKCWLRERSRARSPIRSVATTREVSAGRGIQQPGWV